MPLAGCRTRRMCKAMIDMIVHKRLLGVRYSLFDRMKLLRNVGAIPARFNHPDNILEMAPGPFQALDDARMGLVKMIFSHATPYPPGRIPASTFHRASPDKNRLKFRFYG